MISLRTSSSCPLSVAESLKSPAMARSPQPQLFCCSVSELEVEMVLKLSLWNAVGHFGFGTDYGKDVRIADVQFGDSPACAS